MSLNIDEEDCLQYTDKSHLLENDGEYTFRDNDTG